MKDELNPPHSSLILLPSSPSAPVTLNWRTSRKSLFAGCSQSITRTRSGFCPPLFTPSPPRPGRGPTSHCRADTVDQAGNRPRRAAAPRRRVLLVAGQNQRSERVRREGLRRRDCCGGRERSGRNSLWLGWAAHCFGSLCEPQSLRLWSKANRSKRYRAIRKPEGVPPIHRNNAKTCWFSTAPAHHPASSF